MEKLFNQGLKIIDIKVLPENGDTNGRLVLMDNGSLYTPSGEKVDGLIVKEKKEAIDTIRARPYGKGFPTFCTSTSRTYEK